MVDECDRVKLYTLLLNPTETFKKLCVIMAAFTISHPYFTGAV